MNIDIWNKDLERVLIIDDYYSLVWIEKYAEVGEFTLELPIKYQNSILEPGYYVTIKDSDRFMVIEDLNPVVDEEFGSKYILKGGSGETILNWRVTTSTLHLEGSVNTFIWNVVTDNMIAPTILARMVPNLVCRDSSEITYTLENIYDPDSLYNIVKNICDVLGLGFCIEFDKINTFTFFIYEGLNRSYSQTENSYVVFSKEYDNLLSSDFVLKTSDSKNSAFVVSDDSVISSFFTHYGDESLGVDRKELVVDATDVDRNIEGGGTLSNSQYTQVLTNKAQKELEEKRQKGIFDGEVSINTPYEYKTDFNIGDIVQCNFENGNKSARIVEYIIILDEQGITSNIAFDFDI